MSKFFDSIIEWLVKRTSAYKSAVRMIGEMERVKALSPETYTFCHEVANGYEWPSRAIFIRIENLTIGDQLFVPEVVKALRVYIQAIEAGEAGREQYDKIEIDGGTELHAVAVFDEPGDYKRRDNQ